MIKAILYFLILLSAIPVALISADLTKNERAIYKKYFPKFLFAIAVLLIAFLFFNLLTFLTLAFLFLFLFIWLRVS